MSADLAENFLIHFVNNLIEIKAPEVKNIVKEEYSDNNQLMQESLLTPKETEKKESIKINNFQRPVNKIIPVKNKIFINQNKIQNNLSATDKLDVVIRDPYVSEIECSGIDIPLMVKKFGKTLNTQIKLSVEEIYEIISEFSQKTRIPIINGKIKAALNNLIITAVLSETLGPRFIIQKNKAN